MRNHNGIYLPDHDSHISKWVEETGRLDHDQSLLPILLEYIKEGDWVVDAGAFIGDHTIAYLKKVGPMGVVIAFEPFKESYECLVKNCPSAINLNMGLDSKYSSKDFVTSTNMGATFLHGQGNVATIPLDLVFLPRLNFFKIDVEGMEEQVIDGATMTIERLKPVICCEINVHRLLKNKTDPEKLMHKIISLGYSIKKVYDSDELDAPQYDLLFIPL